MSTTEDATASAFEVPAWEPSTEGRAIDTAPWESAGRGMLWQGVGLWPFTVAVGVAFVWAWAIGARWTVVVLFGVAAVACMVFSIVSIGLMISARSSRRLLESHGWREATVQVYTSADRRETRLLVGGDTESRMLLDWYSADSLLEFQQEVLARTGRIWLIGQDSDATVRVCSAGLAVWNDRARVVADEFPAATEVLPGQVAPARLPRASDDVVVKGTLDNLSGIARWLWYAASVPLVSALAVLTDVLIADDPYKVESLFGVGFLVAPFIHLAMSLVRVQAYRRRVERLLGKGPWTAVPVALRAGTTLLDRMTTIRGRSTLPGGHSVDVRLKADYQLTANIAATGLLWVAGEPAPGQVVAAGLPGYPHVALARFGS